MDVIERFSVNSLSDTFWLITSSNYRYRLAGEINELILRIGELNKFLDKFDSDDFKSDIHCDVDILNRQLKAMNEYLDVLLERGKVEGIITGNTITLER